MFQDLQFKGSLGSGAILGMAISSLLRAAVEATTAGGGCTGVMGIGVMAGGTTNGAGGIPATDDDEDDVVSRSGLSATGGTDGNPKYLGGCWRRLPSCSEMWGVMMAVSGGGMSEEADEEEDDDGVKALPRGFCISRNICCSLASSSSRLSLGMPWPMFFSRWLPGEEEEEGALVVAAVPDEEGGVCCCLCWASC